MSIADQGTSGAAVVVGEGHLTEVVVRRLEGRGHATTWLEHPSPSQFGDAVQSCPGLIVVVTRDDAEALRLALLATHGCPEAHLVVTVFDRTVAQELREAVPSCDVVSMAELVAPAFVGPCVRPPVDAVVDTVDGLVGHLLTSGTAGVDLESKRIRPHRLTAWRMAGHVAMNLARPHDLSARMLIGGLVGLLGALVVDVVVGMLALHESLDEAVFYAVRTMATVQANEELAKEGAAVRLVSAATMLATLAAAAVFAAGLVNRLLEPRHVGVVLRRAMPRRDHVIVVGMGQVGFRVATLLRTAGVPVVGVERRATALGVRLGRRLHVPMVVAEASDRAVLEQCGVRHARAVAVVTSDDVINVAIALAVRAINPGATIVLRAGDGGVTSEVDSLLHLGVVIDAHELVAEGIAAAATGDHVVAVLSTPSGPLPVVDPEPPDET